jgi:hypothetical protein
LPGSRGAPFAGPGGVLVGADDAGVDLGVLLPLGERSTRSGRATTFLSSMSIVDTKAGEGRGRARADPTH